MINVSPPNIGLICVGILALTGCVPETTREKIPLAEAEALCGSVAEKYARRPLLIPNEDGNFSAGLLAEYPDDFQVQNVYRRCVISKSGQRPGGRLKWRL